MIAAIMVVAVVEMIRFGHACGQRCSQESVRQSIMKRICQIIVHFLQSSIIDNILIVSFARIECVIIPWSQPSHFCYHAASVSILWTASCHRYTVLRTASTAGGTHTCAPRNEWPRRVRRRMVRFQNTATDDVEFSSPQVFSLKQHTDRNLCECRTYV